MANLFIIESRRPVATGWTDWRSDEIGENRPRGREECSEDLDNLAPLGTDWAMAEYRIVEVKP